MKKKQKEPKPKIASKPTLSSKANISLTDRPSKQIRIEKPFPQPPYVKEALQRLSDADYVGYIVGGSVRDFLLGRPTKDHDIATNASPDELCELFPNAVTVGKAFGVLKIPIEGPPGAPEFLEIATFREDLEYRDHRHPRGVKFSGPTEDARRRDFTINALFYDPKTSRILDFFNGYEDLRAGVLRAIGDPTERFREDALRLLRGVRFATSLGFVLEEATQKAIRVHAKLVNRVSAERIRDEMTLMLKGPKPAEAVSMLSDLGLMSYVIPELRVSFEQLRVLRHLAAQSPQRSFALSWSGLLFDVGRTIAAKTELDSVKIAKQIGERLKWSRDDIDRTTALVGDQLKFRDVFKMREATLERFIREPYFQDLLALHHAQARAMDGNLAFYEFCLSRFEAFRKSPGDLAKLIDGKDLIHLGFHPGPEFSEILRTVDDLTLERKLHSKEEALEFVVKQFVK